MADLIVDPTPEEDLPPARAANNFRVSRIGSEAQVIVGFIDVGAIVDGLQEVREAAEAGEEGEDVHLHVQPVTRLTVGPQGLHELKTKIDEIYEAMLESGHIPPEVAGAEAAEEEGDDEPAEG